MMSDYVHDVSEASRTVDYALGLAKRKLEAQFGEGNFTVADCIALAAIAVTKLNMMHDCDMRYLDMDRWDRRTPRPAPQPTGGKR